MVNAYEMFLFNVIAVFDKQNLEYLYFPIKSRY